MAYIAQARNVRLKIMDKFRVAALFLIALPGWSVAQTVAPPVNGAGFAETVQASMAQSLEKQRESVRKQVSAAVKIVNPPGSTPVKSFYTIPWPTPVGPLESAASGTDCEPMSQNELDRIVTSASEREGLSSALVKLVIGRESAAKPCAVSAKGAQGLMQLMPATAAELGVLDPFDPQQNVDGGTRMLKRLLTKYNGDKELALGAYNAGSGRVDREGGVPAIPETLRYVTDILSRFQER